MASVVDALSGAGNNDFPANIAYFSRSKTLSLTSPYAHGARSVNYKGWIEECVPNVFLRTILDG